MLKLKIYLNDVERPDLVNAIDHDQMFELFGDLESHYRFTIGHLNYCVDQVIKTKNSMSIYFILA